MILLAKPLTSEIASLRRFSEPRLRRLLIFQKRGKAALNLSLLILVASSKAVAKGVNGREGRRYSGSKPNAILQMLSNVKRWRMS